jgi:DedD protein
VIPPAPVVPAKAGTQPAPVAPAATPVAPAKAGARQSSAQAAPKLEGFAIQVGAFKEEAKLQQAHEKLVAAKIPHYVERRGDLNRLRAGPYSSREAAEKALASIKAASLDGQVVPLP